MSNLLWSLMAKLSWSLSPRRSLAAVGVVVAAGVVFFPQASPSSAAPSPETRLRAATAKYHSVNRALADGFVPTEECAELLDVGVMGYHYVNPERLGDGMIDANKPDILLYTKGEHGRLRLAGVEWFAVDPDQDLPPTTGDRNCSARDLTARCRGTSPTSRSTSISMLGCGRTTRPGPSLHGPGPDLQLAKTPGTRGRS